MGNYDLCLNSTDNKFYVVHVNVTIDSFTGICLPKECSNDENILNFKKNLSKLIHIDENDSKDNIDINETLLWDVWNYLTSLVLL